jgi:hypothetical protein
MEKEAARQLLRKRLRRAVRKKLFAHAKRLAQELGKPPEEGGATRELCITVDGLDLSIVFEEHNLPLFGDDKETFLLVMSDGQVVFSVRMKEIQYEHELDQVLRGPNGDGRATLMLDYRDGTWEKIISDFDRLKAIVSEKGLHPRNRIIPLEVHSLNEALRRCGTTV